MRRPCGGKGARLASMWLPFVTLPMAVFWQGSEARPARPTRNYDLQHVKVDLDLDFEHRAIRGTATNTITLLDAKTKQVQFDCAKLTVSAVRVNRRPAKFSLTGETLKVTLPTLSKPKAQLDVAIDYSGKPEAGLYFVRKEHAFPARGPIVFTQGEPEDTRYWVPTYDYPDDRTTTETVIRVPKGNFVLSNGKLLGVQKGEQTWTYHWRLDQPHSTYLISVVAGDYVQGREKWGDLPVDWYVPRGLEEEGRGAFAGTADMVKFFSELTGFKYPFAKYSQSAVPDFMFGGMENTTCTTQTIRCLHHPREHPLEDWSGLVLHELAHQWFGDTVTCADWSHIWINEGFATFLPSFYVRKRDGQDAYDYSRYSTFQGGLGGMLAANRPMVFKGYSHPMDVFDGNAYPGGASRLFMLMHQLGEKPFWKGIADYLKTFAHKNATTEHFFASMAKSTGVNLETFRRQWFYTASVPKLRVTREGQDVIVSQSDPAFSVRTELAFWQEGQWVRKPVMLSGKETKISAEGLENAAMLLDPDVWLMGQIDYAGELSAEECVALYKSGVNAAQRARLLDRVGSRLTESHLSDLLEFEQLVALKERLIGLLGEGSSTLRSMLDHPDVRLQNAAVARLAAWPADAEVRASVTALWKGASREASRLSALRTLFAWGPDETLLEEALAAKGLHDQFRIAALGKICEMDRSRGRALCMDVLRDNSSEPLKVEAVTRLGGLKDEEGSSTVFEALVASLREGSFARRRAAIQSLASFGDKRAIPELERFANHGMHFTRRAAQSAADNLKKLP